MERYRQKKVPEVIYGDREPPVVDAAGGVLRGLAASGGYYIAVGARKIVAHGIRKSVSISITMNSMATM